MATNNCGNSNCGCTNTYTVTAPCPPSCPEVFNASCIVYTGTDIVCNLDTVISRYDYLDTVITKLVNYICNVQAPVTVVAGSTYIDVVPNTIGNVTTYTVSVDIPALQAYFDIIIAQAIASSFFAGPGILVAVNPITSAVTISHADTSSVANLNSNNSGNSFIQDIFFTFDTFGHVTGASVTPGSVIPPLDFAEFRISTDVGYTWGPVNDPSNPQIAEVASDGLTFVAGAGINLYTSTVGVTDAIRIEAASPATSVTLSSAGGTETLVNDGTGPTLATKGLTAGTGVSLTGSATDVTITNSAPDQVVALTAGAGISTSGTYPNFTITNTDTGSAVTLASAGGSQTLVNDGTGPSLATKGLTAGTGINLFSSATAVTIATLFDKFAFGAIAGNQSVVHGLGTLDVIVAIKSATLPLPFTGYINGTDYTYVIDNPNQITITDISGMGAYTVTVIG